MTFHSTIPCTRPAVPAWSDDFGNELGQARPAVEFVAVYAPVGGAVSQIIDGVLRETTVTKPTLYVEGRPDVRSGDRVTVAGESGWQVDGDPVVWPSGHPFSSWVPPMIIELRRTVG